MKTDSKLSAYCHGNADFANVWERCWPTYAIPIYKGAIVIILMAATLACVYTSGYSGNGIICNGKVIKNKECRDDTMPKNCRYKKGTVR